MKNKPRMTMKKTNKKQKHNFSPAGVVGGGAEETSSFSTKMTPASFCSEWKLAPGKQDKY